MLIPAGTPAEHSRSIDTRVVEGEVVTERSEQINRLARLSTLLDASLPLGSSGYRIGIDPIIGLIPGIGDLIGTVLSSYIIYQSALLGVSRLVLFRMIVNVMLESIVGVVPIIGDLFDFVFKANQRNIALLRRSPQVASTRNAEQRLRSTLLLLCGAMIAILSLSTYLFVLAIRAAF